MKDALIKKILFQARQNEYSPLGWLPPELIIIIANKASVMILIEKYGNLAPYYAARKEMRSVCAF